MKGKVYKIVQCHLVDSATEKKTGGRAGGSTDEVAEVLFGTEQNGSGMSTS